LIQRCNFNDDSNLLEIVTIEAFLRVKKYIRSVGVHVNKIRITKEMMGKFNLEMYNKAS